jgi:hypothetical protein
VKIQRVYIDTSVIGGCFDSEFALWSNGLMQDFQMGLFRPVISDLTTVEINVAPDFVQNKYAELLDLEHDILEVGDEALDLLGSYQMREVIGDKYRNDMLHIALATVAEVDILVSWNFKHIVHFDKIRRFNAINSELGYKHLDIHSPREVTHYDQD